VDLSSAVSPIWHAQTTGHSRKLRKADAVVAAPLYYILILPGIITVFFHYCFYDLDRVSHARISALTINERIMSITTLSSKKADLSYLMPAYFWACVFVLP
jgi:hypothetical protein